MVYCDGVREYAEAYQVELDVNSDNGRLVVRAFNQGKHDCTEIDVLDFVNWLWKVLPEIAATPKDNCGAVDNSTQHGQAKT